MFYVPKIKEKLLGYISNAFSRFSSFCSVQEMRNVRLLLVPTWSEGSRCKPAVKSGLPTAHMPPGLAASRRPRYRPWPGVRISLLGFCICWCTFSLFSLSSALMSFSFPNQTPAVAYLYQRNTANPV